MAAKREPSLPNDILLAEQRGWDFLYARHLLDGDASDLDTGGRSRWELLLWSGYKVGAPPQNLGIHLMQDVRRNMGVLRGGSACQGRQPTAPQHPSCATLPTGP